MCSFQRRYHLLEPLNLEVSRNYVVTYLQLEMKIVKDDRKVENDLKKKKKRKRKKEKKEEKKEKNIEVKRLSRIKEPLQNR